MQVREDDRWDPTKRVSLIVDTERLRQVENPGPLGRAVEEAFPSAVEDIRAAGNCLAVECNTAAVFHLMRVAEVGLLALARDRRVKLPRKEVQGLEAWASVFRELERAEDAIRRYPKTLAQEAQIAFHHKAMTQFGQFREVFHDQVRNTRHYFGADQAKQIQEVVRAFMQTLASRIAENVRTPLVWKGKKWMNSSR